MNLLEQFKASSTAMKVIIVALLLAIVAVCCSSGLLVMRMWPPDVGSSLATETPDIIFVTQPPPSPESPESPESPKSPESGEITGWRGEYFNNIELQGEPVLVRDDSEINFDWGSASPAPEVPAQNFSVRWAISVESLAGTYHLTARFDNGVRLWVDDNLIIDQWRNGPVRNVSADVNVAAGNHNIRVEYYHPDGPAVGQLKAEHIQNSPN